MSSLETKSIKQASVNGTPQPLYIGGTEIDNSDYSIKIQTNGIITIKSGTTLERPLNPIIGSIRYNTDYSSIEQYCGADYGWKLLKNNLTVSGGNIVTINNGYKIHIFTSSGTLSVTKGYGIADYLIVAGGGGGGGSGSTNVPGGGGAGGMLEGVVELNQGNSLQVIIGSGGAVSTNGTDSYLGTTRAIGGGRGGSESNTIPPSSGGSGGGGAYNYLGADGIGNQGSRGGSGGISGGTHPGGGGGGAGGSGGNGVNGFLSSYGYGGPGRSSSITGQNLYYAGGGGGSGWSGTSQLAYGGRGGGGNGGYYGVDVATAGEINSGGGGGAGYTTSVSKAGGSGIVIVRYLI